MVKINSKALAEILQLALAGIEAKQYELYELQFNTSARSVIVYNPASGDKFQTDATFTKSTDFRIGMAEAKRIFEYVKTLDNIDVSLQLSSKSLKGDHFQIGLLSPGRPRRSHMSETRSITS